MVLIGSLLRRGKDDHPEIELAAYAADCRITGRLRLTEARLSDMLNRRGEITVIDAHVLSYVGMPDLEIPRLTIHRDDLYAVLLTGPRGDAGRRLPTAATPIGMKAGPYLIRGHIHVTPGTDALAGFRTGREMVPLTDGWIARTDGARGEAPRKIRVNALLVNRRLADWAAHAEVDDKADAAEACAAPATTPLAAEAPL